MYGKRIGEKPELIKNYVGQQKQRNKTKTSLSTATVKSRSIRKAKQKQVRPDTTATSNSDHEEVMIDGEKFTLRPIGYNESCRRKHTRFVACKREASALPQYYHLKHKPSP